MRWLIFLPEISAMKDDMGEMTTVSDHMKLMKAMASVLLGCSKATNECRNYVESVFCHRASENN